jgi:hypothetical protein
MDDEALQAQVDRMLTGYWVSQAIHVAAKLGVADLVMDGSRTADELAKATGSNAPALYRLLRALASLGFFSEGAENRFALAPLGKYLRSDVPGSKRSLAIMTGEEHYQACAEMHYSVQTGKAAYDKVFGMPVFDYLSRHPDKSKTFDEAMVGVHGRETGAMLEAYDFSSIGVLADVGGGNGSVLRAVLQRYPKMKGILYDLPGVVERAKAGIQAAGLESRCQTIGGSFFDSIPTGAAAYMMRHIIHDWDDEKSIRILKNIHKAMSSEAKLLVVEGVIPPGNEPSFEKLLDLAMLIITGGKERTEAEYRALYEAAGFRLTRIVPTRAGVSVIEGKKA